MATISALKGGSGVGYATYHVYSPQLSRRYSAAERLEKYAYMYTDEPDTRGREGFSLAATRSFHWKRTRSSVGGPTEPRLQARRDRTGPVCEEGKDVIHAMRLEP